MKPFSFFQVRRRVLATFDCPVPKPFFQNKMAEVLILNGDETGFFHFSQEKTKPMFFPFIFQNCKIKKKLVEVPNPFCYNDGVEYLLNSYSSVKTYSLRTSAH